MSEITAPPTAPSSVQPEVAASINLAGVVRVDDDGIDWYVGQVAGLVVPCEPVAWGRDHGADNAEHVAGSAGTIVVEATDRSVSNWSACRCSTGIQGDAHDRTVGQNGVAAGNVHPGSLSLRATTHIEADLHVAVVGCNDSHALVLGRVLYFIDVRAVAQSTFRQVCRDRVIGDVPRFGRRRAGGRFPNAGRAGK